MWVRICRGKILKNFVASAGFAVIDLTSKKMLESIEMGLITFYILIINGS